jgi:hypothetical protein
MKIIERDLLPMEPVPGRAIWPQLAGEGYII